MNKAAMHQAKNLGDIYRAVSGIILRRLPLVKVQTSPSNSNIKDPTRKPEESLYLLVKKPRKYHAWQFPQGGQEPGESAAEAALRELKEECGSDLKSRLIDIYSPVGTYQYKFPPKFNRWDNAVGAKVR
jgi:8-oxo-dGTP pyrophosphatase MutT (NUDIX family)